MMKTDGSEVRRELLPLPLRMLPLPVHRGYPVPAFVAQLPDGTPEFRLADQRFWRRAVRQKLCWICGSTLGVNLVFLAGPMCMITLTSSEPPCHLGCAQFAVKACPFMLKPAMERREGHLPEEVVEPGGIALKRNPGVIAVSVTHDYRVFDDGHGKPLIEMGTPESVAWYCEGRAALREEVQRSVKGGLPKLMELACTEGVDAVRELQLKMKAFERWLPKE